jgi:hypothetical protein
MQNIDFDLIHYEHQPTDLDQCTANYHYSRLITDSDF